MSSQTNMYEQAKTWNPFKGCEFDCSYCVPTFKRQAKRQKHRCRMCYEYAPHEHPERLSEIPSAEIVFCCGNGDVSFADPAYTTRIIDSIHKHNRRCSYKTYYLQSKRPEYFEPFLADLPENVILVTTLETNRDQGYEEVSKAPPPSERYRQFGELDYPRKVVTIEPVMAFDRATFARWIRTLRPEYVYLGFNSHPKAVQLPEPPEDEVEAFVRDLRQAGIKVCGKELRAIQI